MSNTVHPKHMRLGTRSCAECRRRKVRCVFPNERPPCQQCALRSIPCTAQEPGRGNRSSERLSGGDGQLKPRLAAIESNVRDIGAGLGLTVESSALTTPPHASLTTHGVEIYGGAEPMPSTRSTPDNTTLSAAPGEPDAADVGHGFEDAPLLALFKAANITEEPHPASSQHSINFNADAIHMPNPLMLQDDDLLTVLAATAHYWQIWPPWQYGIQTPTIRTLQAGDIEFAARFLSNMASSNDPPVAAKALLWLSLCLQQAPKTLQFSSRTMLPEKLLDFHMQTADSLLASAAWTGETLHGIEARLLQHKLYVDMGRPRQAWLCVRRAADGALLLRLHRAQAQERGGREAAIWTQIWHLEKVLALILGLPSTIPSPPQRDGESGIPLHTLHHRMCSLAASIGDRDQSSQPSYPATVRIGQELDECRAIMPDSWWHEPPRLETPFAELYAQQAAKVQYFLLVKLLHIPFMLKSSTDAKYEYSRVSALAASRAMINAYLSLRRSGRGTFVVCELLDFQAFSAGIVLIINLLSPASEAGLADDCGEDWRLTDALTTSLRRTDGLMQCGVARQAAEVLGLLTQAARGAYSGPEKYDVVLPYFGRITIALSQGQQTGHLGLEACRQQAAPFGTVEFGTNPFDLHLPGDAEGELGGDWSSMANLDFSFDWTQTFAFDNHMP
ncbi:hypothetical protein B0T18DRAFT_395602 [Schizothecium vesticola]|uniref:Zn(2)-C6 fungal-type domain-containing protein n=1 Tax=Schizothecium vesticola TaxID=314040 RepID=A0AA40F7Z8_9PEZI|nr:hypothetical protein B0T18DRAFT_395602 [Schizothecium vesticola]